MPATRVRGQQQRRSPSAAQAMGCGVARPSSAGHSVGGRAGGHLLHTTLGYLEGKLLLRRLVDHLVHRRCATGTKLLHASGGAPSPAALVLRWYTVVDVANVTGLAALCAVLTDKGLRGAAQRNVL